MIVITVEVAFDDADAGEIKEAMERLLDEARTSAAARITGSYHQPGKFSDEDNAEWRDRAVSYIELPVPTRA